ncbi:MAG TPA: hypothetical protein VHD88_04995 [Pyrinomonadaceae bacterium]|nr:hypothetical protein [Pyrinomonadaceae bacterium]
MVNETMQQCPFCSVPLDPAVVALIAERQEKANQACSDASYVRTAAIAMFVFLGVSLIPFVAFAFWGFLLTFIAVLVMLIRWQVKFGNLLTSDPDYKLAKRSRNRALGLWIAAIPLGFVVRPLIDVLLARLL